MTHLLIAIIYLAFISLGLPDSLLGTAWPVMYGEFGVPVSYAGAVSMLISLGTVVSSLQSDRLTRRLGTGKVTAISVAMTAAGLWGFSVSTSYWMLCLWTIPYGLGAGSVDAALNNYVALHYASRHMSWLHCMWGIGASIGPYIMGFALSGGQGWPMGYRYISMLQIGLAAILIFSLPLWKNRSRDSGGENGAGKALTLPRIVRISGAKEIMTAFFCYCGVETTTFLWSSSYLVLHRGIAVERAAGLAALFYLGMTVGRGISGFLTMKLSDPQMVRLGLGIALTGVVVLTLPPAFCRPVGLMLLGLGYAPIYPCVIHSTPTLFGAENSQAVIGVQMASAYTGSCLMPPVFGLIARYVTPALLPAYLAVVLALTAIMYGKVVKKNLAAPNENSGKPSTR